MPRLASQALSFSCGIYMRIKATIVLIPRNRTVNSAVMIKKYLKVSIKVLMQPLPNC